MKNTYINSAFNINYFSAEELDIAYQVLRGLEDYDDSHYGNIGQIITLRSLKLVRQSEYNLENILMVAQKFSSLSPIEDAYLKELIFEAIECDGDSQFIVSEPNELSESYSHFAEIYYRSVTFYFATRVTFPMELVMNQNHPFWQELYNYLTKEDVVRDELDYDSFKEFLTATQLKLGKDVFTDVTLNRLVGLLPRDIIHTFSSDIESNDIFGLVELYGISDPVQKMSFFVSLGAIITILSYSHNCHFEFSSGRVNSNTELQKFADMHVKAVASMISEDYRLSLHFDPNNLYGEKLDTMRRGLQ